jgi:hypothetical protein
MKTHFWTARKAILILVNLKRLLGVASVIVAVIWLVQDHGGMAVLTKVEDTGRGIVVKTKLPMGRGRLMEIAIRKRVGVDGRAWGEGTAVDRRSI